MTGGGDRAPDTVAAEPFAPADLRLLPAAALAWATAFVAPLAAGGWRTVVWLGPLLLAVAALAAGRLPGRRVSLALVAGALVAGAVGAVALLGLDRSRSDHLDALVADGAVVSVDVELTSDPRPVRPSPGQVAVSRAWVAQAVITRMTARGATVSVASPVLVVARAGSGAGDGLPSLDEPPPGPGERVEFDARLVPSTRVRMVARLAPVDGVRREQAVLRLVGSPVLLEPPNAVQSVAASVRADLRSAVVGLAPDARGLVPGLVVGDELLMPPDLVEAARVSGLGHLTAVSGANVAIILVVLLTTARWVGLRGYAIPVVGALALVGFVVLARPEPSVLRAAVMGAAVVLGLATGARRHRLAALLAAVVVLLLVDPWLARSYGFALSVIASGAILVLVPGWVDRWAPRLTRPLATAIAVPTAASLACAPVVVLLSGAVSLVSVLANGLAAPAVGPATVLGVAVAILAPVAPAVAGWVAWLAGVPAGWIAWVARWTSDLPMASLPWPASAAGAVTLALATLVAVIVARGLGRWPPVLLALATACVAAYGTAVVAPGWPPAGWHLAMCDVGQGDALVLATAGPGVVVVDAGPDPRSVDDCLDDLGVHEVALAVVTHEHADHLGGLAGVFEDRDVGAVVTGAPSVGGVAEAIGVRATPAPTSVATGTRMDLPGLTLRVVWPPPDPVVLDPAESAPNNASVVLLAEWADGTRALLAGDLEPSAQRALRRLSHDLAVDVLKVPHHGSSHQDPSFLAGARAVVALISVGAGNDYGHPAAGTLSALERGGAVVLRTDLAGDVVVGGHPGSLWVRSRSD